jgi:asparagine synthase (glutamine-hydrolysing)
VLVGAIRLDGREDLRHNLGVADPTVSDAALVMAAFQKWGRGFPAYLLGDFAVAIVDTQSNEVLLARDLFASRPLYYRLEPGKRLLFGSEAAQILVAPGVPTRPFEPAIAAHLAGPYTQADWSFYDGIEQLAGGHRLVIRQGRGRPERFWDVDPDARIHYRTEREYAEHFREVFAAAVGDRLRTRGPLGIQLSGGMDSGSTASVAGDVAGSRGVKPTSIRTYSYAFEELVDSDERAVSDQIVDAFGFVGIPVNTDELWPLAGYPDHGPVRDDPFVLTYTAANDAVRMRAHADGVKLLLVPESGDEVVGTQWVVDYVRLFAAREIQSLWRELRLHSSHTDDNLVGAIWSYLLRPLAGVLKRRLRRASGPRSLEPGYPPWVTPKLASRTALADIVARGNTRPTGSGAMRNSVVFSPTHQRWATDLERRHARAGLAYSDPFADKRVVEFVLSIPQVVVNRPADDSKRLLRKAMRGVMPATALAAARKAIPESLYGRGVYERGRSLLGDLTVDMRAAEMGFVDERAARRAIEAWTGHGAEPSFDPWWLISLEWWLRGNW